MEPRLDDELERLLEDCDRRLSAVSLRVEGFAEPPPVEPAPRRRAPARASPPAPAPAPEPPRASVPPAPARRLSPRLRSALVVAAGLAAAAAAFRALMPAEEFPVALSGAEAAVLRRDRGDILVASRDELAVYSIRGRERERLVLAETAADLGWREGALWTLDGESAEVVERPEGGTPVRYLLDHVPAALHAADRYLWTVERGGRSLRQYLISRSITSALLQPIDQLELPPMNPLSVAAGDGELLVLDDAGRLHSLRPRGPSYRLARSASLAALAGPGGKVRRVLPARGGWAWALIQPAGRGPSLRRVRLASLPWSPAR